MTLNTSEIQARLAVLPGWTVDASGMLTKTYVRANFMDGFAFVAQIAALAEAAGHHPDILLTYPRVTVSLITHDADNTVTEADFALATEIEKIVPAAQ